MQNWKSESSALKKVKPSPSSTYDNNFELSGIPNDISEDNLKKVVFDICHSSDLEIEPKDIEGCHCLLVSRYSKDSNTRVIVKFVNKKHPEAMLRNKKSISNKNFFHWMFIVRSLFVSLCPYYWHIWGKCKDLQRRGSLFIYLFSIYLLLTTFISSYN